MPREAATGAAPTEAEAAELLGRVSLFAGLSEAELRQLAGVAVPRSYEAGEVIFREGDSGDTCYILRSGSVKVTHRHSDGRAITLAELRPGQIFGELAMFSGETRSATVEALEPTTALALLAGDVRRTLANHPEIAVKMLVGLADRLREANERIVRQSFQTVAGRVAQVLMAQVAARQSEGAADRDVLIRATQADIAQLAGSSRESASRFLATLERAGVVTCGRGKVVVHDPSALRNYVY
jgi:CRP/FNR family cyclic AMP-dependent transcriptional regulator